MSETVFKKVDYTLQALIDDIAMGEIGLPDLQRPFVWKNAKIRNLFDSMYRGFPVGYLLFWESATNTLSKTIGADSKQKVPRLLIVDGQQRLTSLYAVVKGIQVIRENYDLEKIEIAFNPLTEKFEVADAAIRHDKAYIANISVVWEKNADIFEIADDYLEQLESVRSVDGEEKKKIRKAINKLSNLLGFPFIALELSSSIDEEQVSEVFVRINSEGKKLNQSDFILTLMSVFWDGGRKELEEFCREARNPTKGHASPFNHFIHPDPDQLLRVSVGVAFKRARLQYVYSILRGKDLETEEISQERREAQFALLKKAQSRVLNLQYWHDFLKAIRQAGFRSMKMISSQTNLLFAYILYLMGRAEYGVDEFQLRHLIARWFFMTALTGRYSSSPESKMEFDLARFKTIRTSDEYVHVLKQICDAALTSDYWTITLPTELATAAARSPSMFAYYAALNLLDALVLFSKHKVAELMDPSTHGTRSSLERHHIFPKAYLKSIGVTDNREINQIANFTMVEWGDNAKIADMPPAKYYPLMESRFDAKTIQKMHHWHALPDGWNNMEYSQFLQARRELMARIIRDAYLILVGGDERENGDTLPLDELVVMGETTTTEFKSTLRVNLHTRANDPKMELSVLKTIAAFLNHSGGTLIIGVADDGQPVGIDADKFPNEDKFYLHLVNLINARIGPQHMMYIHPRFEDYDGVRVMAIECVRAKSPVFVKDGNTERFYVRTGASTTELSASQTQEYIKQRFV